jgi:hypothetical protein
MLGQRLLFVKIIIGHAWCYTYLSLSQLRDTKMHNLKTKNMWINWGQFNMDNPLVKCEVRYIMKRCFVYIDSCIGCTFPTCFSVNSVGKKNPILYDVRKKIPHGLSVRGQIVALGFYLYHISLARIMTDHDKTTLMWQSYFIDNTCEVY